MKVAALDLGSNTFLMLVVEIEQQTITRQICDETRVVKLGAGISYTQKISSEALTRAEQCFKSYQAIVEKEKPDVVVAVATSASRDASNRREFEALAKKFGFNVQTITGEVEAQITFRGATYDFDNPEGFAVIDVGGGSTEIIGQNDHGELVGQSLDIGSVRLTDQFFPAQPPSFEQVQSLQQHAFLQLQAASSQLLKNAKKVIGVAGTPTSLACLERRQPYDERFVHKSELSLETLQSWILKLFPLPVVDREKIVGMPLGRSDVLVAGTCILASALRALKSDRLTVSTKGVRYGLALEWKQFQ